MPGQVQKRAAIREAALIDVLTASFAAELEEVVTLLTAKMRRLVRTLQANADGRIVATQQNLALALRLRSDLLDLLETSGYRDLALRAADEPLDRLARQVLAGSTKADLAVRAGAFDLEALVALKEIRFAELLQVGEDIAVQLWRITVDGVLGARPTLDLVDDVADLLEISAKHARTVYDTAVSTFSRQVGQLGTSGEADEAFLYVGPDDEKTRAFCAARVDRVYSRAAIDAMDNGQLPNPMLTGGGFSCRHSWRRVSRLDRELLDLVNTDVRYQDRSEAA